MWSIKLIINEQNKSKSIDIENRVAVIRVEEGWEGAKWVNCMVINKNETWW